MRFAHNDVRGATYCQSYCLDKRADVRHRALGCGAKIVGVRCNVRKSVVDIFAELVKSVVSKRRIEADNANIGVFVNDVYTV